MQEFCLIKLKKICFVDDGICGETYRQNNNIKYYSIICSFESIDKINYSKFENICFLLKEEELNRLINESFYYDKNTNKIYFKN